jgi:pyruvate dehydrogenase E1 component alpha subunit
MVDGMDVLAVRAAGRQGGGAWCGAGKGPYHAGDENLPLSRPFDERSGQVSHASEEVDEVKTQHDPIDMLKKTLLEAGHADEDALKAIDREVREIVAESARFAQESPEPPVSELMTDILIEA